MEEAGLPFRIRLYKPGDREAVYQVCLKTGDAGQDATHLYDDPEVLGHLYVGPYITLEPELAFVLEDDLGVCGYCLGALDTEAFFERFLREWLPPLQARYPDPAGPESGWTRDQRTCHELHHPDAPMPAVVSTYPSHLHIDLLPRAQGKGNGRRLMETLLETLRRRGSLGVHLALAATNLGAFRFYRKLGFVRLDEIIPATEAIWMGRKLP
jgi:ribosomal protein S18 acetylase RimI-like enzyme